MIISIHATTNANSQRGICAPNAHSSGGTDADLEALRRSVVRGAPFGEASWQQRTAKKLGLQSTLRPCGRPRKTIPSTQQRLPTPLFVPEQVATLSGGRVLSDAESLSAVLEDLSYEAGPPVVRKTPIWSRWWLLGALLVLLTVECCWRRFLGSA